MSEFTWTDAISKKLIEVRHDPLMDERFLNNKTHAHKIKKLWEDIALGVDFALSGAEEKKKYNYLLGEFRKHALVAKKSGAGAIKWRFYEPLKHHLLKDSSEAPVDTEVGEPEP